MLNGNVTNVFGGLGVMREHVCVQLIATNMPHTQNKMKHEFLCKKHKDKEQSNRKKEELA